MFFSPLTTLYFSENNKSVLNPMQGFYVQVNTDDAENIKRLKKNDAVSLCLLAYNLNGFQETDISKEKMEELRTALEIARISDMGVIFRAAYGFSEGYDTKEPQKFDRVTAHIEQMAPVLNEYKDVILAVQAGMLGPWGEWHSSRFYTDDETEKKVFCTVAKNWHDTLDNSLQLQLRTPAHIREAVNKGVPISRLGFHNDALVSSGDDMGTYSSLGREEDISWVKEKLYGSFTGGETADVSRFSNPELAIPEFYDLGLTYLNLKYNPDVIQKFKDKQYSGESAFEYIKKHLGMRLYLSEAVITEKTSAIGGSTVKLKLTFTNTGFATIREDLRLWFIVRGSSGADYIEPQNIEIKNNSIIVKGKITARGEEDSFSIGALAGYGDIEALQEFKTVTDGIEDLETGMIFAYYEKSGPGYKLK